MVVTIIHISYINLVNLFYIKKVANRIITVGDHSRAKVLAELLDQAPSPYVVQSERNFLTITGRYKGVPVSIVAIGMVSNTLN